MPHKKKILLVEDDQISAKMVQNFLAIKNFDVTIVSNGNDVIPAIVKEKPDLILMDVQISGSSGLEVAKVLKTTEEFKKIPVFMVTAFTKEKISDALPMSSYDEIIEKPIVFKDFLLLIEKYLDN